MDTNDNTEAYYSQLVFDTFTCFTGVNASAYHPPMGIDKILESRMKGMGLNPYSLSDRSGVPQPTIQRILSGHHKDPRSSTVKKLAAALSTTESFLRGEEESAVQMAQEPVALYDKKNNYTILQYHDQGGAMGSGVLLKDQPGQITGWTVTPEWIEKNIPANTGKQNLRIVTGFGDSMKGMYNSGDPLLVDTGVKTCEYDGVYFFRVDNEGFIKRLQRIPGQGILVISKNPEYRDWVITADMDFEIFGRVLRVWNGENY